MTMSNIKHTTKLNLNENQNHCLVNGEHAKESVRHHIPRQTASRRPFKIANIFAAHCAFTLNTYSPQTKFD